mmetsp:Transcript_1124/g.3146  ORF Transcript_1124/g.3146 Transcript_1124/m.3146 type:complete len:274 (-) Transcript_1124:153-974(-)
MYAAILHPVDICPPYHALDPPSSTLAAAAAAFAAAPLAVSQSPEPATRAPPPADDAAAGQAQVMGGPAPTSAWSPRGRWPWRLLSARQVPAPCPPPPPATACPPGLPSLGAQRASPAPAAMAASAGPAPSHPAPQVLRDAAVGTPPSPRSRGACSLACSGPSVACTGAGAATAVTLLRCTARATEISNATPAHAMKTVTHTPDARAVDSKKRSTTLPDFPSASSPSFWAAAAALRRAWRQRRRTAWAHICAASPATTRRVLVALSPAAAKSLS